MDKVKENLDTEVEEQDETPETKTDTPEEKTPAPKKAKVYTDKDLMERGRDDATLTQKRKELEERETKVKEAEERIRWQPVAVKYGEEGAAKIKSLGLAPDAVDTIADLLGVKVPPIIPKVDSGATSGGASQTFQDIEAKYIKGEVSEPEYREARKKANIL